MIPKILHFVWVGDETKRPDKCIQSWRDLNPDFEVRIWGNKELAETGWINAEHIKKMAMREINGVADIMRYEILYYHGGIALDADSICLKPLPDWLLETDIFTCYENELLRGQLLAAGYMGAVPEHPFMAQIIKDIHAQETVTDRMAWESVGPQRLTDTWKETKYPVTIYPSHYFIPTHHGGTKYIGRGLVFADQLWGSTKGYEHLTQYIGKDNINDEKE